MVGGEGGGVWKRDERLTVVTRGAGVSRPRAVAGEGAPRLGAAAAVLAQVGETSAEEKNNNQISFLAKLVSSLKVPKCFVRGSAQDIKH